MAQIRTRKQKVATGIKREQKLAYSLSDVVKASPSATKLTPKKSVTTTSSSTSDQEKMFGYSIELIKKDILKTILTAGVIVVLLAVIIFFNR